MKVEEFENAVLKLEDVVIRIRMGRYEDVDDFDYRRQAKGGMTVSQWLETRIIPFIRGYDVDVIDGSGHRPHGATQLETVRHSYKNG